MTWMSLAPILPVILLSWQFEGEETIRRSLENINPTGIACILYISLIATVAAFAVWGRLLTKYPATVITPYALLIPVVGMTSSSLFLNEEFNTTKIIAAAMVVGGVLITSSGKMIVEIVKARST